MSIRSAWQSFINPSAADLQQPPPTKRRCERSLIPSSYLADSAVSVVFRHPFNATPPPRLAAFALPASIVSELHDKPHDVCFCLTLADGDRVYGSALQTCEAARDECVKVRTRCERAEKELALLKERFGVTDDEGGGGAGGLGEIFDNLSEMETMVIADSKEAERRLRARAKRANAHEVVGRMDETEMGLA